MMPRIKRIKVKRGGPLEKDFEIQPGDLNLVYGLNETGKTYLLESLVRLLFKTKGRDAPKWKLREWDTNGKILVSGIEGKGQVTSFSELSKKLEDYRCGDDDHLPRDFSRLLVVRAGETVISTDPKKDGIGRDILKDYLSGNRLLDDLGSDKKISKILKKARIEGGVIVGHDQGEINTQTELRTKIDSIKALLDKVDQNFSEGPVSTFRKELEGKKERKTLLEKAKKHESHLLRKKRNELKDKSSNLVNLSNLGKMEADIERYRRKEQRVLALQEEMGDLSATIGMRDWCVEARQSWDGIEDSGDVKEPGIGWMITVGVLFLSSFIFGFVGQRWLLSSVAILGLGAILIYLVKLTRATPAAAKAELTIKRASQTYQKFFDEPLDDPLHLSVKEKKLDREIVKIESQVKNLEDEKKEVRELGEEIKDFFSKVGDKDLEPSKWEKVLDKRKREVNKIESEIKGCDRKLEKLSVEPRLDLEEDPGVPWDVGRFNDLSRKISELESSIQREEDNLLELREEISNMAGKSSSAAWDQLLEALQDLKESTLREYRKCTAEILAKIGLWKVLEELKQKENEWIEQGLERDALRSPLSALTGDRYESIHFVEEEGLQLSDRKGNSYSLGKLSTGVREQICLALRFGFASIALGGEPAFLLLDDAFQHSDWERRPRMIEYVVELTRQGWQVFYFTMDDHIRDQFKEAGKALGSDRFLSMDLGAGNPASAG